MIDCLSRMRNYSGGKELAEKLAAEWIEAYPTRKLMVSELKKLLYDGFHHDQGHLLSMLKASFYKKTSASSPAPFRE